MSNNHMELWALLDFVSKSHVGDKKDFKQYYEKALKAGMKMDASQHELRQRILRQADLRRLMPGALTLAQCGPLLLDLVRRAPCGFGDAAGRVSHLHLRLG